MYCDCHVIVSVTPPLWNSKLWPKMMEVVMLEYLPLGTNDREKSLLVEEYQRRVVCHGEGAGSEQHLALSPSPLQLWRMDVATDT